MIRVYKQEVVPASLQKDDCNKYDDQDVQVALYDDQNSKCYLCEQNAGKSTQIEHLRPKAETCFPELKYKWTNLFLSCPYCNGRKSNALLILDPANNNIEEIIVQRLDAANKKLEFTSDSNNNEVIDTIALLNRLHNGKNGLRDRKAKAFYNDIELGVNSFLKYLLNYKENLSDENKQIVIDSLKVDKEFLGLKYWMIKDYGFNNDFKDEIVWNKK